MYHELLEVVPRAQLIELQREGRESRLCAIKVASRPE